MRNPWDLEAWYRYVATAPGFLGSAFRAARAQSFLTEDQQRALLHIQDETYNSFWLRLQGVRLPHPDRFSIDVARIVAALSHDLALTPPFDLSALEAVLQAGIQHQIDEGNTGRLRSSVRLSVRNILPFELGRGLALFSFVTHFCVFPPFPSSPGELHTLAPTHFQVTHPGPVT